ncbi:imidazolonepropionase-like amidohydrolase [Pedobacter africanus]|uniref:Imidazolonepropionase-like amidohydrolase n=1 Tax=Pedobacter africanus TaxID=151894 RepID=A0ACC6KWI1_9SPHI|nr:amidohydrolase family protein [Pedobacter africanus]MDR6783699.1 imidazolonepropionase-like amidohydrolase [Pedobacter africanus]
MKKILLLFAGVFAGTSLFAQQTYPVNGTYDIRQGLYAFTNANIVVSANKTISKGTLLIKGQTIQAAGNSVAVPKGYVVIDLKGKFIYPSLIDAFTAYGLPEPTRAGTGGRQSIFTSTKKGPYGWNEAIRSETQASTLFSADSRKAAELRKLGFGSVNVINRDGIARGTSVAVTLSDEKENSSILNTRSAANYSFNKGTSQNDYPTSLMGAIALLRQTYYDAQWYGKQKEEYNISLEEFNKQQNIPQIFEADGWQNILRVDKIGKEFGRQFIIKSNGDEYQRVAAVKATGASLIIPVNFIKAYDVEDTVETRDISLAQMKAWELAPGNAGVLEKAGIRFSLTTHGLENTSDFWPAMEQAINKGLTKKQALMALTEIPAAMLGIADKTGTLETGKLANFIITSDSLFKKENVIEENWVQGKRFMLINKDAEKDTSKLALKKSEPLKNEPAGPLIYPFTAFGNTVPLKQESVLLKNATVWTNEKEGILQNADVLIENGKIRSVGKNLNPGNAKVIDATGKHITPGMIDEHSHIVMTGGINEGAQSSSAEVRVGDIINSEDVNIYRQLAGGVTTSQILHGSANPVGGQSQLIKLRWGKLPEELKFEGADGFIKFALGENVKQSNFGTGARFPVTRMGVEQTFVDQFTRAKAYKAEMAKKGSTLRRDLELDAIAEILDNKRFITCHSYVQSEINMLMKVADSLGFKINTFTHILEGYKVADKMKARGINASTFSDWWAYKMEVAEAIPYNGKIMHNIGITTAFNSDDAEMARRLNQEAGKAILYGGVPEEDALKFVTLNPAKMLHIDNRVGSLKAGKDADVVVWSAHPLSIYAKAEKTFVDGIAYWDMERDTQLRAAQKLERARLIQKMKDSKGRGAKTQKPKPETRREFHCETVEDYSLELNDLERSHNHE